MDEGAFNASRGDGELVSAGAATGALEGVGDAGDDTAGVVGDGGDVDVGEPVYPRIARKATIAEASRQMPLFL